MKGALPSQRDGGWQQVQLGGTSQSSAWGREQGVSGGSGGPKNGHHLPGQTQKPAKGLSPTQHPESSPSQSKLQGKDNAMHSWTRRRRDARA